MKAVLLCIMLLLVNCTAKKSLDATYHADLEAYWTEKMDSRKKGYLQLVALTPLNDTVNVFGKHPTNNLQLAISTLPDTIGFLRYSNGTLTFEAVQNGVKTQNDSLISSIDFTFGEYGSLEQLAYDRIKWQIITRANKHYLRVWDTLNPEIAAFKGFRHFETDANFIFEADFSYYNSAKTEEVQSKLGVQTATQFVGQVSFNYQGTTHSLDVSETGFLMVGDATNGDSTYGGGRYIYLDLPQTDGKVMIDFNHLYNPPCSYSDYTTCLFPPRQNRLPFAITAGETLERIE